MHLKIAILLLGTAAFARSVYDPILTSSMDPSSYANVDVIQTYDFTLTVDVSFDQQVIKGSNILTLRAIQDVSEIVLDYQGLVIESASYQIPNISTTAWNEAYFETQTDSQLGNALRVYLTDKAKRGDQVLLDIKFHTTNESLAINWLTKEQTSSGTLQYLYTKCEPIHCRGIAPLQDTPSIKTTYSAYVTVPQPYRVNMSAVCLSQDEYPQTKTTMYSFRQSIPIPSYLLALVIGNLAQKTIDYRTSVITEPDTLEEYAGILKNLGNLLNETEKYVMHPYIWGKYTILVLPPSFPVGGMENPLLTFASPTIMVKDGSQIYVATHEIAHSWSGNLVTCKDWLNLWLNEGFTTFIERRVSAIVDGEGFASVESLLGNASYYDDMAGYGQTNSYSSLYPLVNHTSPDSASSQVTYEKGQQFMEYIKNQFDKETDFQEFLGQYFNKYSYQSITFLETRLTFNDFVRAKYDSVKAEGIISRVNWVDWVQTPGPIPAGSKINFETDESRAFQKLADDYIALGGYSSPANIDIYIKEDKNVNLKVVFNNQILQRQGDMNYRILSRIDTDLSVTASENPEIGQRWFPLAIALNYDKAFDTAKHYVQSIGRQKYILPVYTALVRNGYRNKAYQWYNERKTFYHPIAAANIRKIIFSSKRQLEGYDKQIENSRDVDNLFLQ
ncbi:hypothetical protein FGO68_gene11354 [Halteria grandinella]|uniref:Peptidase M1 leukotriene A4 hydrolase/aminopeptidase C-terminal domain-containing protein n=1 Tax=Halteria grandinella TaxID=5974 RepID=A0A8J8NW51_HALGN|nr:hypothetical protein FGO68_gene11354 [Halteria grandinella]